MAKSHTANLGRQSARFVFTAFLWRQIRVFTGFAIFIALALGVAALATWNIDDPSLSHATGTEPVNILGIGGAFFADGFMQLFGLAGVVILLPALAWSLSLISGRRINRLPTRIASWGLGALLAAAAAGCMPAPQTWPLPNGIGGVAGDLILRFPALFIGAYPSGTGAIVIGSTMALPAIWFLLIASGLVGREPELHLPAVEEEPVRPGKARSLREMEAENDDPHPFIMLIAGATTHIWYTMQARLRRLTGFEFSRRKADIDAPYDFNEDEFGTLNEPVRAKGTPDTRSEPSLERDTHQNRRVLTPPPVSPGARADVDDPPFDDDDRFARHPADILVDEDDEWDHPAASARSEPAARSRPISAAPESFRTSSADGFTLPSVQLLAEPKNVKRDATLTADALDQNARMLESVLEDFGVRGEILHVRPGPVVTLYELEPAPGIKSSRVIGLADDIARSMSSIAARVAVVPGRNAIGIELPNRSRETVFLRELIDNRDFDGSKAKLAITLGKTIGGEPVIADLAKMPHLLVAGTTGSGKSVAINTMILSLLYRMTPEQCRLIMIDPKMLELSVYDGIPHLLTPVVTDPKKAVVALKWAVREMEERYKKMSKIGVRNIDGFNSRVEQALARGEVLNRTVQTGFDRQTGEAIYETEEFDLEPIPYIVVIIDEMADLMMVAGKDIEGAVQRLAQMARAAGIHVIMATQRPSVDVITGTIKANFPTRISFQVTSKIDSRTILGEQGAEQLLGMGDMLYMAGGGRIQRVHGPFVSDTEVEEIVAYLKTQGAPQYLEAVTADDDEEGGHGPAGTGNLAGSDDPYDQAVAIVLRDGKASTSYIQRRLGIGYNRAASLIERMEQEGLIGPANHAGKREILVPTEADVLDR
ncbi:FtsK/SpoIIIE family DNA translocase [Allorhizobium borbori]|uniref:DNA translocase FtsK n=1 Tax=Allorhizobium borbori TaxID=485907 RepID=A0A7W6P1P6_9HYPH|nr:DNA translocase FtsK [Allorhizobium borbori]MBB4103972.1 S-DNA-T family DNA segregation ATPase FtsK/SpoIIIE [Allorhizobium borbori]